MLVLDQGFSNSCIFGKSVGEGSSYSPAVAKETADKPLPPKTPCL